MEAKRLLAPFEVNSTVSSMRAIHDESLHGEWFLIYLSGREDEDQLAKPLKCLARVKQRSLTVLYARRADFQIVVHWARVVERTLPERTEFCFNATDLERALNLRPRSHVDRNAPGESGPIDIPALRTDLGLTQSQLGLAIGVSERTVQNWEAGRLSSQAAKRLRDLIELRQMLERYIMPEERENWLISPNDTFAGDAPRDWIIEGRARDLLLEFRRMQVGEPL